MKRLFYLIILLHTFTLPHITDAQIMSDYCQMPPFLANAVEPNVLLLIDTSGSMGWMAYCRDESPHNGCDDPDNDNNNMYDYYNPNVTYEGYFNPEKFYTKDTNGVYVETTPTGQPCQKTCVSYRCRNINLGDCTRPNPNPCGTRWYCCEQWQQTGDCNIQSGNYLNYANMTRIDLLRWALTGGRPDSCNNSIQTCDPELYPNNQLSCDSFGCILNANNGTKVKVPLNRITGDNGGLLFQLKNLGLKPRIGAMFFDSSGVNRTVYIGDFTASANFDGVNPYKNTITAVNYEPPGGTTPIAPALWDAYNYLRQSTPQYGGPQPQTGSGNEWKNPMYQCLDSNNDGNCQGNEFRLVPCAKNFIILLTDGQWNKGGLPVQSTCNISDDIEAESPDPVVPAYWLHKKGFTNIPSGLQTYVEYIYAVGMWLGGTGELALKNVAMYGSFDRSGQWPGGTSGYPQNSCNPVDDCCSPSNCGKGSPCTPLPSSYPDWDKRDMEGNDTPDGIPDTFFKADDAVQIKNQMVKIILDILRSVSSGTAVSILASGGSEGANLLQAFFYPKKVFEDMEIDWVGEMQNLWYNLDPTLQSSTIREDTVKDRILDLQDDYIVHFRFDYGLNKTRADRYNNSGVYQNTVYLEDVKNLWEAGKTLWLREASTRTIYTSIDGTSFLEFSTENKGVLQNYLQATDITEAEKIINYIYGIDQSEYRNRTVTISSYDSTPRVWKLGDIISSTPKLQSWVALNNYHLSAPYGYSDTTYQKFIDSKDYKNRGMVYVGSNSGMLHAFKLGLLKMINNPSDQNQKAKLEGNDLGKEIWAYIPKNSLPYLKYLADPDYCHLYYVDASPYLVDASIAKPTDCSEANYWDCERKTELYSNGSLNLSKTSWRTVLIGGMGLGGACRKTGTSCTDCVKTPTLDPSDTTKGLGYSSYFAIDVTDPNNPSLMWEFSNDSLGFSTSGPVIVRTGDKNKNGRWFAVFGSGPTGRIDTSAQQFYGRSDQNLRLFILDLKTGELIYTIDTGIQYAFAGSSINTTIDTDRWNMASSGNYQDDVFYIGYVKKDDSTSTWTKGGVLRVTTNESIDPKDWVVSTLIDNIGPVTSSIAHLQDRKNHTLWLYFGTGRYFYKIGTEIDDADSQRAIYGLKEPCYNKVELNRFDPSCSDPAGSPSIASDASGTDNPDGWYINLDSSSSTLKAERVITNPLAAFTGAVFFTTFAPTADVCGFGGNTYLWAVNYSTGGAPSSTALYGTALVQVSTGEIKEIALSSAFTEKSGRRTVGFQGVPPKGQGLTVVIKPQPIRKILHMRER